MLKAQMDSWAIAIPTTPVIQTLGDQLPDSFFSFTEDQSPGAVDDKHLFHYPPLRQSSSPHPKQQEKVFGSVD
jgi:hypothetical protein